MLSLTCSCSLAAIIALIAGHLIVTTLTLLGLLGNLFISKQWYDDILSLLSVTTTGILLHRLFTFSKLIIQCLAGDKLTVVVLGLQSNHPIQYRLEISVYFLVTVYALFLNPQGYF